VIESVGEHVDASRVGERVVLRPVLGCESCPSCRAGDINRCKDGRLVGRDLAGGFAELFAVPALAAVCVPDDLPDDVAVLCEPLANAEHVAARAVREGDRVFVIGSGPIGVLMARAALLHGASRALVTDPVRERLRFAEACGAEPIMADDPAAAVLEATDGEGADVVIDAAGFEATWALGLRAVRAGGHVVEVGLGAASGTVDFFAILGKEATISGSYAWNDGDFARSLAMLEDGALDPEGWITRMPLADGQRAFEELVDGPGLFKVVLEP
jgi:2-desacetyl-2-hydroxyethyl bacteriochlorophyllide A dehydrogenase